MANKHTIGDLQQMQSLPLKDKIAMTKRRIEEWYEHYDGHVYVSFSGGKDSTVLLHMARELYPDIKAVFVDTGLEYPEIRKFVMSFENVDILKPKMNLVQVIKKYGYPVFSKEVSECVYGARKYLTSIIESGILDRPTDRPTDHGSMPTRKLLEREHSRSIRERKHHIFQYETDRLLGSCQKNQGGGYAIFSKRTYSEPLGMENNRKAS